MTGSIIKLKYLFKYDISIKKIFINFYLNEFNILLMKKSVKITLILLYGIYIYIMDHYFEVINISS